MKAVGLITEYNPFHNGHKYHLDEAKRITGADYAVAVMSGNFVQRGTPAVIDKYARTEMALTNGIDLVLELPVCYAAGSAEFFSHGAVSLLDKLGIVDTLCFGSECGDIEQLRKAAWFLSAPSAAFEEQLQAFLKEGISYPAARLKALKQALLSDGDADGQLLSRVLTEPNNILGIEYMKALSHLNSTMVPVTLQRKSAHYHDDKLNEHRFEEESGDAMISSATAIRKAILGSTEVSELSIEEIKSSVPDHVFQILMDHLNKTFPITEEDFAQLIKYRLLYEDNRSLSDYMDVSADMADRMKNISDFHCTVEELSKRIKSKNLTLTRINRALTHLLLNIRTAEVTEYNRNGYTQYARVLGIRKESTRLLKIIDDAGRIPLITKVSKAAKQLDSLGLRMLNEDINAAHLYSQAVYEKFGTRLPNEYQRGICIL